jgi:hypothetical protein
MPAISIRIALTAVSRVPVSDPLRLPATPKLKISNSAPKISPLTPASESIRLPASEKQCMAPKEQIRLTPKTTIEVGVKAVRVLRGSLMLMGKARTVIARLTTPPIANSMAAKSTKPCFSGEAPFIFHDLHDDVQPMQVKARWTR